MKDLFIGQRSRQIADVLDRYFKGKQDLVKLVIETDKLTSPLYFDWSSAIEDTFPHIYGPINLRCCKKCGAGLIRYGMPEFSKRDIQHFIFFSRLGKL